jgi:hypothetical protein
MFRPNKELLKKYPCHIVCNTTKHHDVSDARLIRCEGFVEGLNMLGQVFWSKEAKCNEIFDIASGTSQISVYYQPKLDEKVEEGLEKCVGPHLVNIKWEKSLYVGTSWKKIDPDYQASDNDYEYRPECLAGNHTGIKIRMCRKLPDGRVMGCCTQCVIGRKGHEKVPGKDMVARVTELF